MWGGRRDFVQLGDVLSVPPEVRGAFDPKTFTVYELKPGRVVTLSGPEDRPYELYTTVDTVRRHPALVSALISSRSTLEPGTGRDVWGVRHDGVAVPLALDACCPDPFPAKVRLAMYMEDAVLSDDRHPLLVHERTLVASGH